MELIIVSGFIVFLPKYLETQFALSKSEASMMTGELITTGYSRKEASNALYGTSLSVNQPKKIGIGRKMVRGPF